MRGNVYMGTASYTEMLVQLNNSTLQCLASVRIFNAEYILS